MKGVTQRSQTSMSFQAIAETFIPSLGAAVTEFRHPSGARHYHFKIDSQELAFLVAFATYPQSDNGIAHVLEHVVLCGSRKFPVRDPFISMYRRSVASFMNAMTYEDRTVYPFATANGQDFDNLLDVYLDAVFFPTLKRTDFLQEGWRYGMREGMLEFQGVVLNEMRETDVDPSYIVDSAIQRALFEGTPYQFDVGGKPSHIPTLTLDALKDFHAKHYQPANAVFMTAGPVDLRSVHGRMTEVVSQFASGVQVPLPPAPRMWNQKQVLEVRIPHREAGRGFAYLNVWKLGDASDTRSHLEARLLDAGLLGDPSAPLASAMEKAAFGFPSMLCGLTSHRPKLTLCAGMESLTRHGVEQARRLIDSALLKAHDKGVDQRVLKASLLEMRYDMRSREAGSMPFPLKILDASVPVVLQGKPIESCFNIEHELDQIDAAIEDPAFFKTIVGQLLCTDALLNVTVTPISPQRHIGQLRDKEQSLLASVQASLDEQETERIKKDEVALARERVSTDSKHLLPRLGIAGLALLPADRVLPTEEDGAVRMTFAAEEKLIRVRVAYDLGCPDEQQWNWLMSYAHLAPQLGVGRMDYEATSVWRHESIVHYDVFIEAVTRLHDKALSLQIVFEAHGLEENASRLAAALADSICALRLDEHERMQHLLMMKINDRMTDMATSGDEMAEAVSAMHLGGAAQFIEKTGGVSSIQFLKALAATLTAQNGVIDVGRSLSEIHATVLRSHASIDVVGREQVCKEVQPILSQLGVDSGAGPIYQEPGVHPRKALAIRYPSQVNACYMTWGVPTIGSQEAGALAIAAELMTNEYLHREVREKGGAYGVQATYRKAAGLFSMGSQSDPNVDETFAAFAQAIEWVANDAEGLGDDALNEAKICVIRDLDCPQSPYDAASASRVREAAGRTPEMRAAYRASVLDATFEAVRAAVIKYLDPATAGKCAFVGDDRVVAGFHDLVLQGGN